MGLIHVSCPRTRRLEVKGKGQKLKQVIERFLFSWPSLVVQVSSSNFHLYDPSYMLHEETSDWTIFGSKIQVVKLSPRLDCFLVLVLSVSFAYFYCLQESSMYPPASEYASGSSTRKGSLGILKHETAMTSVNRRKNGLLTYPPFCPNTLK